MDIKLYIYIYIYMGKELREREGKWNRDKLWQRGYIDHYWVGEIEKGNDRETTREPEKQRRGLRHSMHEREEGKIQMRVGEKSPAVGLHSWFRLGSMCNRQCQPEQQDKVHWNIGSPGDSDYLDCSGGSDWAYSVDQAWDYSENSVDWQEW